MGHHLGWLGGSERSAADVFADLAVFASALAVDPVSASALDECSAGLAVACPGDVAELLAGGSGSHCA